MSMYRQLLLAILASTLLALLGSLLASTLSARTYLTEQLSLKNADNASALALSLSQQQPDEVTIELAVSSLFDSGHYEAIRVFDPHGKVMAERVDTAEAHEAPAWFEHLLPINAQPGVAQISDGWKQFGRIELVSHSRFAYRALWHSVLEMIAALMVAGVLAGLLGHRVLQRLRRPLLRVIHQAQAITERRFVSINEPDVPELKQLASAMNATVARLKTMFDDEAARLEAVRQEANCDPLTGLANRTYFMARLRDALMREDARDGQLIIARIMNLADINQRLGREATDQLLQTAGTTLRDATQQWPLSLTARLNGADFAVLVPGSSPSEPLAQELLNLLLNLGRSHGVEQNFVCMGVAAYTARMEPGTLLGLTDTALASAEAAGGDTLRTSINDDADQQPRNAQEWEQTITEALSQGWVKLIAFPLTNFTGQRIHDECPLRLMFDAQGEWQPAGRFMPVAERLRLTPRIDLAAIELGLRSLAEQAALPGLAINLSSNSIIDTRFRTDLAQMLKNATAARRLWLEVPEAGAFDQIEAFRTLCVELKRAGCKVGIEHFGRQLSRIGQLQELGLDYVKVDSSFVRGIDNHAGNQTFLKGLAGIAHSMGIQVYAEGVTSADEMAMLQTLGFDGATGPAVKATGPGL